MPADLTPADFFGLRTRLDVARAQVEALCQRVPILYCILSINVIALAYTHFKSNTVTQVVLLPGLFVFFAFSRSVAWVRLRPYRLTENEIRGTLRQITILGAIIAAGLLVWALTLTRSPRPEMQGAMSTTGHAVFFVGVTVVSCVFLLMHHRAAAIAVGSTVLLPFVVYLWWSGRPIETAIGLNVFVVTLVTLYVAVKFSRHFEQSVVAQSELLQLSALNARIAAADMLTSLPNRRRFFVELDRAEQSGEEFAVIVCDLDGFKQVNDVYGHHAGDEVLRQVASRLRDVVPADHCVARMGGDEFTCILVGGLSRSARRVAEDLIAACSAPITASSFQTQIAASAGVCICPTDRLPGPSNAYEQADYALFAAKKAGRNRVELFSLSHEQSIRRESRIAHLLRKADFDREIVPTFQPTVDAETLEIRSFEALARWVSPELGLVRPNEFIPVAERTDLILAISRQMVRAALLQATSWPEAINVKVNLSVRDLMSTEQIDALLAEIARSGVRPSRLTIEVTETILAESIEHVRINVEKLRQSGCLVALDDFGVGYSSLNYIHLLAPDIIKIDQCFTNHLTAAGSAQRIVRTIVELARNVGAVTVAEGVETAEQARILSGLGCDELQGYFFSRPVSASDSTELARRGRFEPEATQLSSAPAF